MRADIGALITLDTLRHIPYRYIGRNTALLECSGTGRRPAGLILLHNRYRNGVTELCVHLCLYILDEVNDILTALSDLLCQIIIRAVLPALRNLNLNICGCAGIDRVVIHLDDIVTLLRIGSSRGILHELDDLLLRDQLRQ